MKLKPVSKVFPFAAAIILFVGCATTRVDWNGRVGNFTFDQSVTELGPPDKSAKLSDGRTVAEWVTRYNSGPTVSVGTGFSRYPGSIGVVQTYPANNYESKLRLTFSTNNVLEKWIKD
ncbi:MAG: hypothetical protein RL616_139 [Verrucomicrobiota bacterium]|jgi:hypothetical protein